MYKVGQELNMSDGSLIRVTRTINATTYEFTVLKTGRQLIDELLKTAQATTYSPPSPYTHAIREKVSAWIAAILNETHKEKRYDRRH